MMKNIKSDLLLVSVLVMLVLSGCNRSGEILYFDRETADGADPREHMDETAQESLTGQDADRQICVHVCGRVRCPGVVMLPEGSRAWEAVQAAGGFAQDAQEETVNLAAALRDGEQLYIPAVGEVLPESGDESGDGPVNLNTADAARLQTLPGIGESRAADILAYRERSGGFQSPEEIMQVPGIKESIYEKIKDKITID